MEWDIIGVVGKGGSSTVYKAKPFLVLTTENEICNDDITGPSTLPSYVAVKQIETDGLISDQIAGIKGEIETMKNLSHPNIVSYLGTQQKPGKIFIILEYADRGSIRQLYQKSGALNGDQISYCLRQLLCGLQYLHCNGIASALYL